MKAYLYLYVCLFYQNDVLAFGTSLGTFGQDSGGPIVLPMNGGNSKGIEEIVVPVQVKTNDDEFEDNVIKPIWVKKTEGLHDSNKPMITYNVDSYTSTEIEGTNRGQSERSENDNDFVNNIGETRQPGSIFFKPYWTSQAKNQLYHHDNNGFNNQPGQNGIYTGSKGIQLGNIVQIGKVYKSQHWKPQYAINKSSYNHPGHTPLSGSKGNKKKQSFQDVKSFYSLSKDTWNSAYPKGKKKVPLKLRKSPYNSINLSQSSTQNLDENGIFSYPNPLGNRLLDAKGEGPIKKQQENQEITKKLPNILNSNTFEEGNANDADIPSEAKISAHKRHKRSTNMNEKVIEGTHTGQVLILNPNSPNVGNNNPVHHTFNRIDLGDYSLNTDLQLEKDTLKSGTIHDKRIRAPKGHSWNQRDLKYSGNLIHPARHSLNPIVLAAKGLNTLSPERISTVNQGGANTNHPDKQSNGNSANDENLEFARNIHYPDIAGMKNVHPKDLLQYLRGLKVLVEPTYSTLRTDVKMVPNATEDEVKTHVIDWKEASKWGGILFRSGSPKNGTRSRFMAFPLVRNNILRDDDDDGPVKYKFHFGGILWWG